MTRMAKIERKTEFLVGGGEMKATNDDQGIVEGYLNYIGNIDFGDDRTMPGAFKQTLADSYARKRAQNLDFIYPYLWNHDYSQLSPGGIFEANEDRKGLYIKTQLNLDIQLGRELYASFKGGFMKKQSMGYKAIQVEWVKEEGKSIRNLLEVAVMEGSCVTFPMNDLAQVDTVKRFWPGYSAKGSASGKTSWPLADRGVSWNKGQAHKDIMAYATSGDTVNWSKAAEWHFWVAKSQPENWGDCKFPFVAKSGGSMKAVPPAIFNGAARLSSANIDDVDGVKKKMAVYYSKMKMPPPWEKGSTMDIWSKDYAESYQQPPQQDWVSDLWTLWYPRRNEIITAFQTGDTPAEDVQKALDQFSTAVLTYVQQGIALDMTEFLQPDDSDSNQVPLYMSAEDNPETKDAKLLSAASHAKMTKAVDGIASHAKELKSELSRQRANALQGYQVYSNDEPVPEQKTNDEYDDAEDEDEATRLNKERLAVYNIASMLQYHNADKGI